MFNKEDVSNFKSVIEDIAINAVSKKKYPKYISAIVSSLNSDGSVNVYIPPDVNNVASNLLNKTVETLTAGDSVELCSKNGSLANAWVAIKHGTNVSGGGTGGTSNYNDLTNKPSINSITLSGNKTTSDLNISYNDLTNKLTAGSNISISSSNVISSTASGTITDVLQNGTSVVTNGIASVTVPTKTSELTNDSNYITSAQAPVQSVDGLTGTVVLSDVKYISQTLTTAQQTQARANIGAGTSSFSGSYTDLTNKPTIPSKTSELTNDSGFITASQAPVQSVNGKTGTVVLTQDDVSNGSTYVQTENNFTDSDVTKLSGIAAGAQVNVIETIQKNGTALAVSNKTVNVIVPTKTSDITNDSGYITSSQAPVQSVNGKTGTVVLVTDDVAATTTNRYVPTIPSTNPETSYLNGNGVFVPVAVGGASSVANIFLSNTASAVSGYKTLNYVADSTSTEMSVTVTNSADVLSATYLYAAPLGVTVIDAGIWKSTFYMKCSTTSSGTNRLKLVCFVRHTDGTETDLFTKYTSSVNSTTYSTYYTETNHEQFTVLATDILGFRVYGNTTRNSSTIIYYQVGGTNASYINSPLALRHTQLRDLNGDSTYQHITTTQVSQIATNTTNIANHIANTSNPHNVTKAQVGLGNVANVLQYSASNEPPYPVTSVNGSTGAVTISTITGNAGTATKLQTSRTIGISGAVTGTATSFDGSTDITIPTTSVDATKLSGTASISTTGNAATASALTTASAGTATRPVYFSGGVPVAGTYTLGNACAKSYTDSSSASAISTSTNLSTERDIYYGLPTINGSHAYNSNTNIYPATTVGTSGQVLTSSGGNTPSWTSQSSLSVGSATKATQDASGNVITTTYATKSEIPAIATTSVAGIVKPDGTSISITSDGTISSAAGSPEVYIQSTEPTETTAKLWVNPADSTAQTMVFDKLPIGAQVSYGGTTAPNGWLICDGSAVSRAVYSELFAIIGTAYGTGDGSTTFNLPNKSGKVSVGLSSTDTNFNSLGKTGGEKTHTLTIAQIPGHTHDVPSKQTAGSVSSTEGERANAGGTGSWASYNNKTSSTGGGEAHNNLQPYQVDNWIIKAFDVAQFVNSPTIVDNLTTQSATNALSANQGYILNNKITSLTPVLLYSNSSGSNGTITLASSSANYSYIEIYFRNNDDVYGSAKVYNPNGKKAVLNANTPSGTNLYVESKVVDISGTTISTYSNFYNDVTIPNGAYTSVSNVNYIYIISVVGYI